MMASDQLGTKLRKVVEELWAEHRAAKAEQGEELPEEGTGRMEDEGCGCQACIYAGQMLYEAGA
jgi:hypothetical protein